MEEIKKFIDHIHPMHSADWDFFASKLHKETVKKTATLIKIGEVENYLFFISEGIPCGKYHMETFKRCIKKPKAEILLAGEWQKKCF